ncbi:methyltransferase [Kribbella sp. DT2]|uniref:methyltransferase n=1 Tax=Kribbella sp. DT2 TaxID=3393427 RepID=UPI003CEC2C94
MTRTPEETEQALQEIRRAVDLTTPYAIRAAVTLDLASHVGGGVGGGVAVAELAAAVGAQVDGVRKLVRLLARDEYFTLTDDQVALGSRGWVLLEDAVRSRLDHGRGYARVDDAWPGLLDALRTGGSGYEVARGRSFYSELGADEQLVSSFDGQLAEWSGHWTGRLVEALGLGDEHVVDVGGGTGALLGAVLLAYPGTRGTLVELPSTAERAGQFFAEQGVSGRVAVATQSFFEPLPAGADLYLIAQVLHNWPDAEAVSILKRLADAAGDAPIVIVERLTGGAENDADLASDLLMYAVFGAGERSAAEFAALAGEAGLELVATRQVLGALSTLELRPRR